MEGPNETLEFWNFCLPQKWCSAGGVQCAPPPPPQGGSVLLKPRGRSVLCLERCAWGRAPGSTPGIPCLFFYDLLLLVEAFGGAGGGGGSVIGGSGVLIPPLRIAAQREGGVPKKRAGWVPCDMQCSRSPLPCALLLLVQHICRMTGGGGLAAKSCLNPSLPPPPKKHATSLCTNHIKHAHCGPLPECDIGVMDWGGGVGGCGDELRGRFCSIEFGHL